MRSPWKGLGLGWLWTNTEGNLQVRVIRSIRLIRSIPLHGETADLRTPVNKERIALSSATLFQYTMNLKGWSCWVERVLAGQQYAEQGEAARGLPLLRYMVKRTGLSQTQ
jgi:hypothetical protein